MGQRGRLDAVLTVLAAPNELVDAALGTDDEVVRGNDAVHDGLVDLLSGRGDTHLDRERNNRAWRDHLLADDCHSRF